MDTLQYPLDLVGWQGSEVIEHAKALAGTVNTASVNLTADKRRSSEFILILFMISCI